MGQDFLVSKNITGHTHAHMSAHTYMHTQCAHIHAYPHAQVHMHTHAGFPIEYWFEEPLGY